MFKVSGMKKLIVCLALLGAATCLAETFQGEGIVSLHTFLEVGGFGTEIGRRTGRTGTQAGAPGEYYAFRGYMVYYGCFTGRVALHHFQGFELYEFNLDHRNYWLALPAGSKGLELVPACTETPKRSR
jgi:hypothetical protein